MKYFNAAILMTTLSFSMMASASEFKTCSLEFKEYLVGPDCSRSTDQDVLKTQVSSVEACAEQAFSLSKHIIALEKHRMGIDAAFCKTFFGDTLVYNYISWEFDDGLIFDSHGTVNAFAEKAQLGKNAFDRDGHLFP